MQMLKERKPTATKRSELKVYKNLYLVSLGVCVLIKSKYLYS